jgi:hypothetical protein
MQVHGHLYGGTPILKKLQIGEALTLAGLPLIASALADADGVMRASTTAAAESIGISMDAQPTRNTAQQTGDANPAVYVTVNVRPDQIVRARLSGSSTAGTALTEFVNSAASTTGLLITSAFGTAYDDGYAWGATGANAGIIRKIQGAVNTTGTPIVAFPSDIAVGDIFYASTFGPFEDNGVQLTSNISELDATGDNQSGTNFRVFGVTWPAKAAGGGLGSYADLIFTDHVLVQQ